MSQRRRPSERGTPAQGMPARPLSFLDGNQILSSPGGLAAAGSWSNRNKAQLLSPPATSPSCTGEEVAPATKAVTRDHGSSVRVLVRVRPLSQREQGSGARATLRSVDASSVSSGGKDFRFDKVLDPRSSQADVFAELSWLVRSFLDGYNSTVLAFGQTGSGKTYTSGTAACSLQHDEGILSRVFRQIFDHVDSECIESSVTVSFVEIHNEAVRDLLAPADEYGGAGGLNIQTNADGEIELAGAQSVTVTDLQQCMGVLSAGTASRATAVTGMHEHSSRSHAIIIIELQALMREKKTARTASNGSSGRSPKDQEQREIVRSKFNLVDLAGSERLKRTNAAGARLREGVNINHGLLTLGKVISALVEREKELSSSASASALTADGPDDYGSRASGAYSSIHVPFRESKLTRLLQDSLGGNARTVMIACVSPCEQDEDETVNTLRYASRARQIKNKPTKNVTVDDSKAQIRKLQAQVAVLKQDLSRAQDQGSTLLLQQKESEGTVAKLGAAAVVAASQQLVVQELRETLQQERAQHEVATAEWGCWRQEQVKKLDSLKAALREEAAGAVAADWQVRLQAAVAQATKIAETETAAQGKAALSVAVAAKEQALREEMQEALEEQRQRLEQDSSAMQAVQQRERSVLEEHRADLESALAKAEFDKATVEAQLQRVTKELVASQDVLITEGEASRAKLESERAKMSAAKMMWEEERRRLDQAVADAAREAEAASAQAAGMLDTERQSHAETAKLLACADAKRAEGEKVSERAMSDKEAELAESKAQVSKLQAANRELQKGLGTLRQKQQQETERLYSAQDEKEAELSQLRQASKAQQQKLSQLRSKCAAQEAALNAQASAAEEHGSSTAESLAQLQDKNRKLHDKLTSCRSVATEEKRKLTEQLQQATLQQSVLQTEAEEARSAKEQATSKLSSYYEKVEALQSEIEHLHSQHGSKQRKLEAVAREVQASAGERQAEIARNSALETRCANLESELKIREASEDATKAQLHDLEANVQQMTRMMGDSLVTQQSLETQVSTLQGTLRKTESQLAAATEKAQSARAAGAQAGLDLAAARTRSGSPSPRHRDSRDGGSRLSPTAAAQVVKLEEAVARQQMEISCLQATNAQQVEAYAELHGLKLKELEADLLRTQLDFPRNSNSDYGNGSGSGAVSGSIDTTAAAVGADGKQKRESKAEAVDTAVQQLQSVLHRAADEMAEQVTAFYAQKKAAAAMIDKRVVGRLLVSYIRHARMKAGSGRGKSSKEAEILCVLAKVLSLEDSDKAELGITTTSLQSASAKARSSSGTTAIRSAPAGDSGGARPGSNGRRSKSGDRSSSGGRKRHSVDHTAAAKPSGPQLRRSSSGNTKVSVVAGRPRQVSSSSGAGGGRGGGGGGSSSSSSSRLSSASSVSARQQYHSARGRVVVNPLEYV